MKTADMNCPKCNGTGINRQFTQEGVRCSCTKESDSEITHPSQLAQPTESIRLDSALREASRVTYNAPAPDYKSLALQLRASLVDLLCFGDESMLMEVEHITNLDNPLSRLAKAVKLLKDTADLKNENSKPTAQYSEPDWRSVAAKLRDDLIGVMENGDEEITWEIARKTICDTEHLDFKYDTVSFIGKPIP
jgi:hypothetical protein